MTMLYKIPLLLSIVLLKLFNVCILFDIFLVISIFLEVLAHTYIIHQIRVDIGFSILCVCACWYSVPITWGWWLDLCVNQWSGIGHCHPRVSHACRNLPVHGRLVWVGMNASGLSIDTDSSSNSENVRVNYLQWLICLNLEFNSHLYITGDMCCFTCYGYVDTNWCQCSLIRKHTLQLVVWNCYFSVFISCTNFNPLWNQYTDSIVSPLPLCLWIFYSVEYWSTLWIVTMQSDLHLE